MNLFLLLILIITATPFADAAGPICTEVFSEVVLARQNARRWGDFQFSRFARTHRIRTITYIPRSGALAQTAISITPLAQAKALIRQNINIELIAKALEKAEAEPVLMPPPKQKEKTKTPEDKFYLVVLMRRSLWSGHVNYRDALKNGEYLELSLREDFRGRLEVIDVQFSNYKAHVQFMAQARN